MKNSTRMHITGYLNQYKPTKSKLALERCLVIGTLLYSLLLKIILKTSSTFKHFRMFLQLQRRESLMLELITVLYYCQITFPIFVKVIFFSLSNSLVLLQSSKQHCVPIVIFLHLMR